MEPIRNDMQDPIRSMLRFTWIIFITLILCATCVFYLLWHIPKSSNGEDSGFELVTEGKQYQEISPTHHRINFGPFTIDAPKEYHILRMTRPFDSYLGGITDGEEEIMFDYGWYSYDVRDDANVSKDTVNGQFAYYKHPQNGGKGQYSLGFYDFDEKNRLIIGASHTNHPSIVEEILKSVHIKGKSSSLNSKNFGRNLHKSSFEADAGRELFDNNCASCHSINRVMVGPALKDILSRREMDGLVKWVQNPQKMIAKRDPYALKLVKEYESAGIMPSFGALKKKEIKAIMIYVSNGGKVNVY